MAETLLLTRGDVAALLSEDECAAAVAEAFRLHAEGRSLRPGVLGVPAPDGGFHIKAAGLDNGRLFFAVKSNANFPGNPQRHGLPTIQGVLVLCDADNGVPLAVMDSMEVTTRRTAAATAVAARVLARPDSQVATLCGCGIQGRAQIRALLRVLPLRRVYAYDRDPAVTRACARELSDELQLDVVPADDLAQAVGQSDVCVTCTPSRQALLFKDQVRAGTFLAAVGADSGGKQELDPLLMAEATVVVDVLEQCATMGDLQHALKAGVLTRDDVYAELAEVLMGKLPGRRSDDEITIFDSTGTALEDVAAAIVVYEKALAQGRGLRVDLGA
jgi:alanine dehydrogenase